MKTFFAMSLVTLATIAPAFADSTSYLNLHRGQLEQGHGSDGTGGETSVGNVQTTYAHFMASQDRGDGPAIISFPRPQNGNAEYAAEKLNNDEHGDN